MARFLIVSLLVAAAVLFDHVSAAASGPQSVNSTVAVPLNNGYGNGTCSPFPVTGLSFTVSAPSPGLQAVLACNQASYQALINADLTQPASANLPAPLLDLSCTAPGTTECTKQMPMNRELRSQVICILLKGATPSSGGSGGSLTANVAVTWNPDNGGQVNAAASGRIPGQGVVMAVAMLLVVFG